MFSRIITSNRSSTSLANWVVHQASNIHGSSVTRRNKKECGSLNLTKGRSMWQEGTKENVEANNNKRDWRYEASLWLLKRKIKYIFTLLFNTFSPYFYNNSLTNILSILVIYYKLCSLFLFIYFGYPTPMKLRGTQQWQTK